MFEALEQVISQIVTLPNIFFCLMIVFLVTAQRKGIELLFEKIYPKFNESKLWRNFLLPIAPSGTGMILVLLAPNYPYPEMFASTSAHLMFGAGCGLFANLIWKLVKENLSEAIKGLAGKYLKKPDESAE